MNSPSWFRRFPYAKWTRNIRRTTVLAFGVAAWLDLAPGSSAGGPEPLEANPKHKNPLTPLDGLGAKATAQYAGDGLMVSATPGGARLACVFQKLAGELTEEGLCLSSTAGASPTGCAW